MLVHESPGNDVRFAEVCRQYGWRRTAQRRAVFTTLSGDRTHPTVDAVWRVVRTTLPDISLDSVYRILDEFTLVGLIRRLTSDKVIRYDADTSPHGHFLCGSCQRLFDLTSVDAAPIRRLCRRIGRVGAIEVTVHGICRDCEKSRKAVGPE